MNNKIKSLWSMPELSGFSSLGFLLSLLTSIYFYILQCLPLLAQFTQGSHIVKQRQMHLSPAVFSEEQLLSGVTLGTARHLPGVLWADESSWLILGPI